MKSDFNFKDLKKTRVSGRLVLDVKSLQAYAGWQTEQLFENIYLKIHQLKSIIDIDPENTNFRLSVRLKNLHKIMILLLKHIKSWIMAGSSSGVKRVFIEAESRIQHQKTSG